MRVLVEVGREESVTRPSWCMPNWLMARRKLWPGISSPTTPARKTSAPKVQALTATLVAPPGTIRSSLNSRIKTGASRAMRVGLPIRYSSATMSPMTRTRLPLKLLMSERKRVLVRPGSDRSSVIILPSPQNHPHCKVRQSQHTPPAPRLTIESVEPFQTHLAQKYRCSLLASREKVVGTTNPYCHRYRQPREIAPYPQILRGGAIRYAQHIGVGHSHPFNDLYLLI